ncbi:MAG: hypothetical protein KGR26_15690, partial [Cyanobacteria bacterium REEB65]|nr:hypothetical protein [Cyanobacteria bacterium REEB65]
AGVGYQVARQWTTGWSILGTKRDHVDLIVNYFPPSFLAPPAKALIEIAWTKGGAVVNTTDYGPWTLSAPDSLEATFDAPVESDGAQIQLLASP